MKPRWQNLKHWPQEKRAGFEDRFRLCINLLGGQQAAAEKMGITAHQIEQWSRAIGIPTWARMITVSSLANVSLDWLAYGAPYPMRHPSSDTPANAPAPRSSVPAIPLRP